MCAFMGVCAQRCEETVLLVPQLASSDPEAPGQSDEVILQLLAGKTLP